MLTLRITGILHGGVNHVANDVQEAWRTASNVVAGVHCITDARLKLPTESVTGTWKQELDWADGRTVS